MTTSALDIITASARLLGVTFKSEQLASDEANDGLISLNDMLDSWSNDNLLTFAYVTETFSLTGASSYTIGSGGTFNTTRPINIATAVVRSGGVDYTLDIIPPEQYQTEIPVKSITSSIPSILTYDNGYPLGTIKMYAVPSSGSSLILLSNKPLSNFAALTTTVDLPPGWKRALKYNLALELAAEYGPEAMQAAQAIAPVAAKALGAIRNSVSINSPMPLLHDSLSTKPYILGGIT